MLPFKQDFSAFFVLKGDESEPPELLYKNKISSWAYLLPCPSSSCTLWALQMRWKSPLIVLKIVKFKYFCFWYFARFSEECPLRTAALKLPYQLLLKKYFFFEFLLCWLLVPFLRVLFAIVFALVLSGYAWNFFLGSFKQELSWLFLLGEKREINIYFVHIY